MNLQRLPLESPRPLVWFAALRVAIVAVALIALASFDVADRDTLIVLTAAVAAPLSLALLLLSSRAPRLALNPAVAVVELALLAVAEAIAPDTYAAVRFLALFLIASHAHFQGEYRGVAVAATGAILLVPVAAAAGAPVHGDLLALYETLFVAAALAAALFMGRLRTAESTGRLRARELSRRVMEAESTLRQRLADAIHDGPVQELVSLDMALEAARAAVERGDTGRAEELLTHARELAEGSIGSLREEIVSLGPYAMDEITLDAALEQCAPAWSRRFGVPVTLDLEDVNLPNDICGSLFGIVQEAVANAGRHAGARSINVSLHAVDSQVVLRIEDDGHGFRDDPFAREEPGHIGLVTMRQRAELAGGELVVDSGDAGTSVVARVPVPAGTSPNGG